jgi:tyrosine-protein kinase Etk/Wzc
LRNAIARLDETSGALPEGEVTLVFFTRQTGVPLRIEKITRRGSSIEILYGLGQHDVMDVKAEHIALIPLGKLPAGRRGSFFSLEILIALAKFLAMGVILGSMLGFGLAFLRDMLDHRLKSVEEIAETLQLQVLGIIPHLTGQVDRRRVGQIIVDAPRSQGAEAVRTLRTALHFGFAGSDLRVIAVTSPLPGDGKSTLASNLAIALAQADQKVLLIDGDLRKPTQHTIFEVSAEAGLGSVLAQRSPVDDAIVHTGVPSLDLLPCGPLPSNPVELLNNGYFSEVLESLKGRYDKIVIDAPPVIPVADARVIGAISDATLLVLRAERSTRRMALGARDELARVRAPHVAVVVNDVRQGKGAGYGYDYGGYGQGGYGYGSYGYGDSPEGLPSGGEGTQRKKKPALLTAAAVGVDEV